MLHIYLSCIRPDHEYAVAVWSPYQKTLMNMLESVQKFALSVCSKQWNTHYNTLLAIYILPRLEKRRMFFKTRCITYLFNLLKGIYLMLTPSLIPLKDFEHNYRSHNLTLKVPFANLMLIFSVILYVMLPGYGTVCQQTLFHALDTGNLYELLLQHLYSN